MVSVVFIFIDFGIVYTMQDEDQHRKDGQKYKNRLVSHSGI